MDADPERIVLFTISVSSSDSVLQMLDPQAQ